jgi:hypothetical protein
MMQLLFLISLAGAAIIQALPVDDPLPVAAFDDMDGLYRAAEDGTIDWDAYYALRDLALEGVNIWTDDLSLLAAIPGVEDRQLAWLEGHRRPVQKDPEFLRQAQPELYERIQFFMDWHKPGAFGGSARYRYLFTGPLEDSARFRHQLSLNNRMHQSFRLKAVLVSDSGGYPLVNSRGLDWQPEGKRWHVTLGNYSYHAGEGLLWGRKPAWTDRATDAGIVHSLLYSRSSRHSNGLLAEYRGAATRWFAALDGDSLAGVHPGRAGAGLAGYQHDFTQGSLGASFVSIYSNTGLGRAFTPAGSLFGSFRRGYVSGAGEAAVNRAGARSGLGRLAWADSTRRLSLSGRDYSLALVLPAGRPLAQAGSRFFYLEDSLKYTSPAMGEQGVRLDYSQTATGERAWKAVALADLWKERADSTLNLAAGGRVHWQLPGRVKAALYSLYKKTDLKEEGASRLRSNFRLGYPLRENQEIRLTIKHAYAWPAAIQQAGWDAAWEWRTSGNRFGATASYGLHDLADTAGAPLRVAVSETFQWPAGPEISAYLGMGHAPEDGPWYRFSAWREMTLDIRCGIFY